MRGIISVGVLLMCLGLVSPGLSAVGEQSDTREDPRSTVGDVKKVELNSADGPALQALPGVGPRTAELIIQYRKEHGEFKKIEELMNVKGIGERTFLRLRELVVVNASSSR